MSNQQLPSGLRWMCNRNGCIAVAEVDAIANCNHYPNEWTLDRWTRPDNRPDVDVSTGWDQLPAPMRIDLARTTVPDEGRGLEIETVAQADEVISSYLAGTKHPGSKASSA
jgi:hypothetical protein